ncbi:InlB B-repeat-containing protein, partial [Candidatus Saccharibacteria bacterium]|nr:InlB B-repeat-containing protein [Candidatus Saccharibacteria bacterium]
MKTNLANTIRKLSSRISTGNKRRSPANGSNTSSVGGVTSLILPALLLLAVFVANGVSVYATTSSITLTIDDATVDMNAISTNANGSFFKSGDSTISATTNNATGYTLKVIATSSSNYNKLINSSDSNAVLTSITSAVIEDDFKNSANTTYNGKWGYLPSKLNSVANTSFQPAPSDVGDTLDITSAANNTANTYTLAIGARIDSSVKIGEYSNTYNVVMVANAIPYTISYEGNVATNMPTNTSGTTESSTITLSSNTPVRSGYEFLGWCDGTVTTANNTDSCSGTTYAAGGTYTLDGTTTNNISLTAMWEMPFCGAHTCMQDLTSSTIATLLPSTGSTATVYDSRDQQQYTIAKLADGKYWMTTNLNLAGGTALSADDTDVTSTYISGFTTQGNLTKSGNTIVLPTSSPTGTS